MLIDLCVFLFICIKNQRGKQTEVGEKADRVQHAVVDAIAPTHHLQTDDFIRSYSLCRVQRQKQIQSTLGHSLRNAWCNYFRGRLGCSLTEVPNRKVTESRMQEEESWI